MPQFDPSPAAAAPRRFPWRWLVQYRLRTVLIVTALVAIGLRWWTYRVRQQREAEAALIPKYPLGGRMFTKALLAIVGVLFAGCVEAPDAKRTDEQKFVEAFRKAFENRDEKAIESLVHWRGVPDEIKQNFMARIKAALTLSGNLTVRAISLEPFKEEDAKKEISINGRAAELNPPATHLLRIELTGKTDFPGGVASGNIEFPVGVVDKKMVLCSQVWVKTKTDTKASPPGR